MTTKIVQQILVVTDDTKAQKHFLPNAWTHTIDVLKSFSFYCGFWL